MDGTTFVHDQWLRKWSLYLGQHGSSYGTTLTTESQPSSNPFSDNAGLRMVFKVRQAQAMTPNSAIIRVYNLAQSTVNNVIQEFNNVVLQAGYVTGHYGIIFSGTIKQYKRGRESATDTYLDIFAADGDIAHNLAMSNATYDTLGPGFKFEDIHRRLAADQQAAEPGLNLGPPPTGLPSTVFPRERVLYGMTQDEIRDFCRSTNNTWWIQNGTILVDQPDNYLPGTAVVLNAQTGMIGMPEDTQQGIMVTSLINPAIQVGGQIKLDNASINQFAAPLTAGGAAGAIQGQPETALTYNIDDSNYYASIQNDGFYMVRSLITKAILGVYPGTTG
jgi:hypothetical protein